MECYIFLFVYHSVTPLPPPSPLPRGDVCSTLSANIYVPYSVRLDSRPTAPWDPVALSMPFGHRYIPKIAPKEILVFVCLYFFDRELTLSNLLGFDRSPLQGAFATVDIHLKKLYNYISK